VQKGHCFSHAGGIAADVDGNCCENFHVNFTSVDIFGTIEFRQYQDCLDADQLEGRLLLTLAIGVRGQVQVVCDKEVEKIDNLFENRLYVTGEELKKMRSLLKIAA
jgi:hypothetical protein